MSTAFCIFLNREFIIIIQFLFSWNITRQLKLIVTKMFQIE